MLAHLMHGRAAVRRESSRKGGRLHRGKDELSKPQHSCGATLGTAVHGGTGPGRQTTRPAGGAPRLGQGSGEQTVVGG